MGLVEHLGGRLAAGHLGGQGVVSPKIWAWVGTMVGSVVMVATVERLTGRLNVPAVLP